MPSLVLMGVRTAVSGDELRCFSVFAMVLRVIEVALCVPLLVLVSSVSHRANDVVVCNRRGRTYSSHAIAIMLTFLILALISAVVQFVNDALIFRVSGYGVPVETSKRQKGLSRLCAIKFGPHAVLRILALVFGIMSVDIVDDYCRCYDDGGSQYRNICPNYPTYSGFLNGLMVTILIEVCATLLVYTYFALNLVRPCQRFRSSLRTLAHCRRRAGEESKGAGGWIAFFRCCCTFTSLLTCCLFGGTEAVVSDFVDISMAMEELFDDAGHLDVTVSDILAGLILLSQEQHDQRVEMLQRIASEQKSSRDSKGAGADANGQKSKTFQYLQMLRDEECHATYYEEAEREVLDFSKQEDRAAITEGAHFMRYALAIYGHGMYLIQNGGRGLCSLGCGALCCLGCQLPNSHGDNPCRCYATAFIQEARIDPGDVVYASFASGVEKRPYCILLDKKFAAIVIVVRGTFALEDAVTDITLTPVSLDEAGTRYGFDGQSEYAHFGMFNSAEWVMRDLQRTGVLDSLLGEKGTHRDHSLYITGHSLGAGVAALLALLLHSSFPTLKCLAFEPPGCVLSSGISQQDYIVSYVYGADLVPRLSVASLENFRDDVLEMIARSKVPKFKVLHPNPLDRSTGDKKLAHMRSSIPESPFYDQLKEFWAYHRDRKSERGERSVQLFVPGRRIVHMINAKKWNVSDEVPAFTAIWAEREDFLEIQLSSSLVADHDPGTVTGELEMLVNMASCLLSE